MGWEIILIFFHSNSFTSSIFSFYLGWIHKFLPLWLRAWARARWLTRGWRRSSSALSFFPNIILYLLSSVTRGRTWFRTWSISPSWPTSVLRTTVFPVSKLMASSTLISRLRALDFFRPSSNFHFQFTAFKLKIVHFLDSLFDWVFIIVSLNYLKITMNA